MKSLFRNIYNSTIITKHIVLQMFSIYSAYNELITDQQHCQTSRFRYMELILYVTHPNPLQPVSVALT